VKYILALSVLLTAGLLTMAQGDTNRVVFVDRDKVNAAIYKGGSLVVTAGLHSRRQSPRKAWECRGSR
jgi:hypothetical protein